MQLLSSKHYQQVNVYIRGVDEPYVMPVAHGINLMDYLTSEVVTKHVKITDVDGTPIVVAIGDIRQVVPIERSLTQEELMEKLL